MRGADRQKQGFDVKNKQTRYEGHGVASFVSTIYDRWSPPSEQPPVGVIILLIGEARSYEYGFTSHV